MAIIDRIVSLFYDAPDDRAKAIIHSGALKIVVNNYCALIRGEEVHVENALVNMIRRLAKIYHVNLNTDHAERRATALMIKAVGCTNITKRIKQTKTLFGGIADFNDIGVVTAITEAIGWMCVDWFKDGTWGQHVKK